MDLDAIRELARADTPENEYWMHVSAQDGLPIAGSAGVGGTLTRVDALVASLAGSTDADGVRRGVTAALSSDPDLLDEARLLVSVKDKRAYLDLSYLFSRTMDPTVGGRTLCGCPPHELRSHHLRFFKNIVRQRAKLARAERAATVIAGYLVDTKGLGAVLQIYAGLSPEQRVALVTHLVIPGEAQQREAKRRGHGAEAELALLVQRLGCTILPEAKATNPMGAYDPNVDLATFTVQPRNARSTASFDLLVLDDAGVLRVCAQSLIQSSDPGQFGVEKAKATSVVRSAVDGFNARASADRQIQLWGLIDGVGYAENKKGTVNPMLAEVHCALQLKSLYKAAFELHTLGLCRLGHVRFDSAFYSEASYADMQAYVPDDVPNDLGSSAPQGGIVAGEAWVVPALGGIER